MTKNLISFKDVYMDLYCSSSSKTIGVIWQTNTKLKKEVKLKGPEGIIHKSRGKKAHNSI